MRRNANYAAVGLFLLLMAVLFVGTLVSYRATVSTANSERWVVHTYDVMGALDSVIFTLQRAQNAADEFVVTGKMEDLAAYRTAAARIDPAILNARTLTEDNPVQQAAMDAIQSQALVFENTLASAVKGRLQGQPTTLSGNEVRGLAHDLSEAKIRESDLLSERSVEAAMNLRTTRLGLLAGALVNGILLLIAAYMIMRNQRQEAVIKESRVNLAAIVNSSDDAIISKKLDGTITSWNAGAEHAYGYTAAEMMGRSIYEIVPADKQDELRNIFDQLARGERIDHLETRRIRKDGSEVEVELTVSPVRNDQGRIVGASAIGRDITRRKEMERSLHQLSVRILRAQDEERRRIAREIHDTTVQKLALLSMNLAQLRAPVDLAKSLATLDSSQELTFECVQELRTLSYVLHPPMLDELGLASALKIYVEGVAQRSGLAITTEVDDRLPRMNGDVEMALFRVAQESLSNVLRHSGSKTAHIRLQNHEGIVMSIVDEGTGMKAKKVEPNLPVTVGVGIPGMNERIRQLGGILTIDSGPSGTTVTARVPVERSASA